MTKIQHKIFAAFLCLILIFIACCTPNTPTSTDSSATVPGESVETTSQEEPAETPGEADTGRISADEIMEERREKEKAFREASGQAGASYPGPVAASENDPGNDMAPEPPAVEKSGRE